MATLSPQVSSSKPPFNRRRKSWARKIERFFCNTLSYFPLSFVLGLASWAIWVEINVSFLEGSSPFAYLKAGFATVLYGLAMTSYFIAVFTSPGSPLDPRVDQSMRDAIGSRRKGGAGGAYAELPTYEHEYDDQANTDSDPSREPMTTVTAKSTGEPRYCKKCQCIKPDRAHHCSTCKRCVLKMDHHCPWLATCVGLRNYKPFILFLVYTSMFCWLCFSVTASWVWSALVDETHLEEDVKIVNCILLAVLSSIIGLVLTAFTAWHIYLTLTGQTTIESLEKTRYLSPLRKKLEPQPQHNYLVDAEAQTGRQEEHSLFEQLKETHANALPGVLRSEEGEDSSPHASPSRARARGRDRAISSQALSNTSPASASLQRNYASLEAQRERDRYAAYLDEQDSDSLPNAFNMGWRRNLLHLFGHRPLYWFLPVCNTSGDGWTWDISPEWTSARADIVREREAREREEAAWQRERGEWDDRSRRPPPAPPKSSHWTQHHAYNQRDARERANVPGTVQMQPPDRRKGGIHAATDGSADDNVDDGADMYDTSSDEENRQRNNRAAHLGNQVTTANWNDVPDDFLSTRGRKSRSRSRGRRKGD